MDDDVIIEPDALIRTYALLSLLKEEYKDSAIAGAMFRLDLRYVQHEADVIWDGKIPLQDIQDWIYDHGMLLRRMKRLLTPIMQHGGMHVTL